MAVFAAVAVLAASGICVDAAERAQDGLVLIEGGTFAMGSPKMERLRGKGETQHEVTLNDFYVDPYEVTQKDYKAVMGKNPSRHKGKQ